MQLINLLISFVVYYPFFRMWDKQKLKEESELETKNVQAMVNRSVYRKGAPKCPRN